MAQGSKTAYTNKQKRQAEHIEDSYKEKGASTKKAERIAWATVNKQDGGAKGTKTTSSRKNSGSHKKTTSKKTSQK